MSGTSFVPGLVILALGLAAGLALARRLKGRGRSPAAASEERDLRLRVADLEARRDELYERLRAGGREGMSAADRFALEEAAARTLRELEQLGEQLGDRPREAAALTAASESAGVAGRRRPALVGLALGGAVLALVGLLFFWAERDATPKEEEVVSSGAPPDGASAEILGRLSPQTRSRVELLSARLSEAPRDLEARKALAEVYIMEGLLYDGFRQTEVLLRQQPDDPDALYFRGFVRLSMGQYGAAVEDLNRAISRVPRHVNALLVRGMALIAVGERDRALADWRAGLDAAGGSHPGLEHLIDMAEAGADMSEIMGSVSLSEGSASEPSFRARIELPPGVEVPPGAVLFVSLRPSAPQDDGPLAVRRFASPRFPLDVGLSESDLMEGPGSQRLPSNGVLKARLDSDGDVFSQSEGDLSGEAVVARGQPATVLLRATAP